MSVAALYGLMETQYAAEIEATRRRENSQKADGAPRSRGDTVTISEEAKALAAEMAAAKQVEDPQQSGNSFERNPGGDAEEDERAREAEAAQQSASSSASNLEGRIKQIEQRIKQLGQQVTAIMNGPGTPESKLSQSMPFHNEINALQKELQELLAEMRQQEQAATASGSQSG